MAETANVRVLINAVTEAAEQAIDEVGDELVNLAEDAGVGQTAVDQLSDEFNEGTSRAAVLQTAIEELEDAETELAVTSRILQSALDEAGDEMSEMSAKASTATAATTGLSTSVGGLNLSLRSMSGVMLLSFIPALLTLATVLAPIAALFAGLAAGAVALAGAFGAIIGSGIIAFGQQRAEQNQEELAQTKRLIAQYESLRQQTGSLTAAQQKRLRQLRKRKKELEDATTITGALGQVMGELREEITPLVVEFGQEFIPLIRDGIEAIPRLVDNIIDSVGGTEQFREALRDFGQAMFRVLPALIGFMFDLARNALPVAREFFSFLLDNGDEAMDDIFRSINELEPEFRELLDAMIRMLPVLLRFGTNAAEVVLPALTDLINAATDFMRWVNRMDTGMQNLVISMLLLAPAILKILPLLGRLIGSFRTLGGLTGAIGGGGGLGLAGAAGIGAGLGLGGVRALQETGAMAAVGRAGRQTGRALGGDATSALLTAGNVASFGGLEAVSRGGAAIGGLAQADVDAAMRRQERAGRVFRQSEGNVAGGVQNTFGDVNISVDAAGSNLGNPFRWSRNAAQQFQRETRRQHGASR